MSALTKKDSLRVFNYKKISVTIFYSICYHLKIILNNRDIMHNKISKSFISLHAFIGDLKVQLLRFIQSQPELLLPGIFNFQHSLTRRNFKKSFLSGTVIAVTNRSQE